MRKLEIRIGKAHCSWYSFHSENNKWAVLSIDLRLLLLLVPSAHQLHSGAVPSPPVNDKHPKIPKVLWRLWRLWRELFIDPICSVSPSPTTTLKKQDTLVMFYAEVHLICVSRF